MMLMISERSYKLSQEAEIKVSCCHETHFPSKEVLTLLSPV